MATFRNDADRVVTYVVTPALAAPDQLIVNRRNASRHGLVSSDRRQCDRFVAVYTKRSLSVDSNVKKRSNEVIGYLRVSTEEQAQSGLGLADQRAAIEHEAQRRDWPAVTFLSDQGFSAKNLERPAIGEAIGRLRTGQAALLVVSKLDRLSRSLLDFATLMDQAHREGWELVVLDLALDTTTPSGRLMANVMASFAEYERQLIGQRTSAALQQRKAQGVRLGRPQRVPDDVADRILREYRSGQRMTAIAQGLQADGVPTVRGGRAWYPSTIGGVLRTKLASV